MMNKYPMWDGTNRVYNAFTSVAVVCCLVSVALFNSLGLKTSVTNLLSVIPSKWNKFIDSGNTPYFRPTITVIYKGKYRHVADTTVESDEVGLPILNSDQSLESFDLSLYKNYYKNVFFNSDDLKRSVIQDRTLDPIIDKEYKVGVFYDLISKTVCTKVLGKTCMIVKPAGKEDMIIHRDNYNRFICDQFKNGEWRKDLISYNNEALKSGSLLHGMYWLFTQILITDPANVSNVNKDIYEPIYKEVVAIYNAIKADGSNIKADKFEIIITALSGFLKSDHPLSFKTLDRSYIRGRFAKDVIINTNAIINNASMFVIKNESTDVKELYKAITDAKEYVLSFRKAYENLHGAYAITKSIYDTMELFYDSSKAKDLVAKLEKKLETNQTKHDVKVILLMEHLDEDTKKYVRKHNATVKQNVNMVKMIMKSMEKIQIADTQDLLNKSDIDKYRLLNPSIISEGIQKISKLQDIDLLANTEDVKPLDAYTRPQGGPISLETGLPTPEVAAQPTVVPSGTTLTNTQATVPSGPTLTNTQATVPSGTTLTNTQATVPSGPTLTNTQVTVPSGPTLTNTQATTPAAALAGPTLTNIQTATTEFPLTARPTNRLTADQIVSTLPAPPPQFITPPPIPYSADDIQIEIVESSIPNKSNGPDARQVEIPKPGIANVVSALRVASRLQQTKLKTRGGRSARSEAYKMFADAEAQQRLVNTKINDGLKQVNAPNWSLLFICERYMSELISSANQTKAKIDRLIDSGILDDNMVSKLNEYMVSFREIQSQTNAFEGLVDAIMNKQVASIEMLPPYIKEMPNFSQLTSRIRNSDDDQKTERLTMLIEDQTKRLEDKQILISELKEKETAAKADLSKAIETIQQTERVSLDKAKAETEKLLQFEDLERKANQAEYDLNKLHTELKSVNQDKNENQLLLQAAIQKEASIRDELDMCSKEKNALAQQLKTLEDENAIKQNALNERLRQLQDVETERLKAQAIQAKTSDETLELTKNYEQKIETLRKEHEQASKIATDKAAEQINSSMTKLRNTEQRLSDAEAASKSTASVISNLNDDIRKQKAQMEQQVKTLNSKVQQLQQELLKKDTDLSDYESSKQHEEGLVKDLNKQTALYKTRTAELNADINTHIDTINEKDQEIARLHRRIEELRSSVEEGEDQIHEMNKARKAAEQEKQRRSKSKKALAGIEKQLTLDLDSFATNVYLEKSKTPFKLGKITQPLVALMIDYIELPTNSRLAITEKLTSDKKYYPLMDYVRKAHIDNNPKPFPNANTFWEKINIMTLSVIKTMDPVYDEIHNALRVLKIKDIDTTKYPLTKAILTLIDKFDSFPDSLSLSNTPNGQTAYKMLVNPSVRLEPYTKIYTLGEKLQSSKSDSSLHKHSTEVHEDAAKVEYTGNGGPPSLQTEDKMRILEVTRRHSNGSSPIMDAPSQKNKVSIGVPKEW